MQILSPRRKQEFLMLRRQQRTVVRSVVVVIAVFLFAIVFLEYSSLMGRLFGDRCDLDLVASQLNSDDDIHQGHFDTSVADDLARKVKVLCLIMTIPRYVQRAVAVNATWAKRCTRYLFVTSDPIPGFKSSEMLRVQVPEGRGHLTQKTFATLHHLYRHHLDDFDWFVKADDDVYIVMENLRFLLSQHSPHDPVYLGQHYRVNVHNGYMSGGAGYVLSRQALKQLGRRGLPSTGGICRPREPDEDVEVGRCLQAVGVAPFRTVDRHGRETFHGESVHDTVFVPEGSPYPLHAKSAGIGCCSQLTITFHYVSPEQMYLLDILLYRISVFGRHADDATLQKLFFQPGEEKVEHQHHEDIFKVRRGNLVVER